MKKIINSRAVKLLAVVCLVLCLSVSMLPAQAFAETLSYTCYQDEAFTSNALDFGKEVQSITLSSGALPTGLTCEKSTAGTGVYVTGTPTQNGSFTAVFSVALADADAQTVTVNVEVKSKAVVLPPPTTSPTTSPTVSPTTSPTSVIVISPVISPSTTTVPSGKVTITKHPTGERVSIGGSAAFVARADNATGFIWRLVSNDASNTIPAKDAEKYFKGLDVSGVNTERLQLDDIPASLNGWYVECKFEGEGGPVYTNGAKITVIGASGTTNNPNGSNTTNNNNTSNNNTTNNTTSNANPVAPTISGQPKGANLNAGQTTTLSVSASVTDGGTVKYQWYTNTENSTSGGTAISGATSSTYQPPQKEGEAYYYVAVWNSKDNKSSAVVYSSPVTVNYIIQKNTNVVGSADNNAAVTPGIGGTTNSTTSPVPTATTGQDMQPANQGQAGQVGLDSTQAQNQNQSGGIATTLLIILGVLAVGLIAAIVFIFLKNGRKAV